MGDTASLARFLIRLALVGLTPYLLPWITPETWAGFVDVLVPVIQSAGAAWFLKKWNERKKLEQLLPLSR